MPIERLCLALSSEAEPLDIGSQAEPRNQFNELNQFNIPYFFYEYQWAELIKLLELISKVCLWGSQIVWCQF
jgi:hypothetical protein